MMMTHSSNRLGRLTSFAIVLFLMAVPVPYRAHAQASAKDAEDRPVAEGQQKKKSKAPRNLGRIVRQLLETGAAAPDQLVGHLGANAGRIGATIDSPGAHAIATIKHFRKLPPEQVSKDVIPALREQSTTSGRTR